MIIKTKTWKRYISILRQLSDKATEDVLRYQTRLMQDGDIDSEAAKKLVDYAHAVATRYGEGAAAVACEMYDYVARKSKAAVAAAVPAATATYSETAKAVYGTMKTSAGIVPSTVGRLVKMAGVDTTMKNAIRDGAEWAWIPSGDSCAFCEMLASNGWQKASRAVMNGDHADHIHNGCDCTFAIRFNSADGVAGYDPDEYLERYQNAEGRTWKDKLNPMRREQYAENKDEINAQKRAAYARRQHEEQ